MDKHLSAELWNIGTSSPILHKWTSVHALSQAVQYDPFESTEPAEGHQGFGGDGCRIGGSCRQFNSGQGPREMGQALLPKPQAFGQLYYWLSLKAQVFAGENAK